MASKRKVSNPLALAVMALLYERPMHPYEMVSVMRERGQHESVRLRYSSLYSVVEALGREGLISPRETVREGRRPERTVYGLTEAGRDEFLGWLRELLREPVKEYTQFAAGLTYLVALPPSEALALLEERTLLHEEEVENEHELVLREAELEWVRRLVREIETGELEGLREWESFHQRRNGATEKERGDV
jgi:DNA-binding PadR family transcriptional regulator